MIHGNTLVYEIIAVNEFDAARRRMSIVVRRTEVPDAELQPIMLLCKGADSNILTQVSEADADVIPMIQANADDFARNGLRTLALSSRKLSPDYFEVRGFILIYNTN